VTTWPTAMVTGHRPQHLAADSIDWIAEQLHRVVFKLRDEYRTDTAVSGMALGPDQDWAESSIMAGLALWAHLPFPQQPDPWPDQARRRYRALLDEAAQVNTYGDLAGLTGDTRKREASRLLHIRNDGMIAVAQAAVAVYRPSVKAGGTFSAWRKLWATSLPIIHINPDRRTVTIPRGTETPSTASAEQETLPL
jgi:hypothetical protein